MISWTDTTKWIQSAKATFVCLLGCATGDIGTILYFQLFSNINDVYIIMPIAMVNGIITSIILETILLMRSMKFMIALKTALGMSLISMISMELAMNFTDLYLFNTLRIELWSLFPVLLVGFITPWPYNYWRLVKYSDSCCG